MNRERKYRIQRTVLITVLFVFLLLGYLVLFQQTGMGLPCPIYRLTGWRCPGCGITHALSSLIRFDLVSAWKANPFVYPMLFYGLGLYLCAARAYIREGRYRIGLPWEWVNILFAILLVLWGIVRNFL